MPQGEENESALSAGVSYIFRVRTDEKVSGVPVIILYAACARSQEDAMQALRNTLPDSWEVEPAEYHLSEELIKQLDLRIGEVRSLS